MLYLIGTTLFTHYIGLWLELLKKSCAERLEREKSLNADSNKSSEKKRPETGEKAVREEYRKKQRLVLTLGVCVLLGVLGCLKYFNFFARECQPAFGTGRAGKSFSGQKPSPSYRDLFLIPCRPWVTWQMYTGKRLPAQRHLGKLALFLGFFPQIMEGPISMYGQTGEALWKGEDLRGETCLQGAAGSCGDCLKR